MNWLCSFVLIQCTLLFVHCRPDIIGITPSSERVTLETQQTASVAAIIKSLENGTPLTMETRKHLAANVAIAEPIQNLQRHLAHAAAEINKNTEASSSKNRFDGEKVTVSSATPTTTTAAAAATSTTTKKAATSAKPTRYRHWLHMKRELANISTENSLFKSQKNHQNGENVDNKLKPNLLTNVDAIDALSTHVNQTNRQYLGNVYGINKYFTESLPATPVNKPIQWLFTPLKTSTQKSIQAIFKPTTQSTIFYLQPDDTFTYNEFLAYPGIEHISSLDFEPSDTETYQLQRPTSAHTNIPQYGDSSAFNLLHPNQNNFTSLYAIIGASTPASYANIYEPQTQSTVIKNKIQKIEITTEKSIGSYQNASYLTELSAHRNGSLSNVGHAESNPTNENFKATSTSPYTKECIIKPDSDNMCDAKDLQIIIRLDNGLKPNKTTGNRGKVRVKQKIRRFTTTTTTTTTPTPYNDYEPYQYEEEQEEEQEEEEEDEDYGFSNYVEPIQNVFSLEPATRKKKHGHSSKPMKQKPNKHGQDNNDVVNKFQTIILQTQAPPIRTTTDPPAEKHTKKFSLHSLLYKLVAFMPFLAIKPIFFGFWTMVLSPIMVIVVSGIALAVTLYPWISISNEQVAYARLSSQRPIIVHRHPVRKIRPRKRVKPRIALQHTTNIKENMRRPPFLRRALTLYPPFYERRETFDNGIRSKRFPLAPRINNNQRHRSKRRVRDTHFQEWLLVQNNFNVRILSHNDQDNYYGY